MFLSNCLRVSLIMHLPDLSVYCCLPKADWKQAAVKDRKDNIEIDLKEKLSLGWLIQDENILVT